MMKGLSSNRSMIARITPYALPALTVTLGLQLLQTFVPGVSWYLRDVRLVGTFGLLPYAFAPFFLALFAGVVRRLLGARLSLWVVSGGVVVLRLAEQASRSSEFDLWVSIAGLTLLLMFIPLFIGHVRSLGKHNSHRWVFGIVLGFALELALRALFGFRPISSVHGVFPFGVLALVGLSIFLAIYREPFHSDEIETEVRWGSAVSLLIFGPYTLLQVLMLGSPGYLGEVANINANLSVLFVMLGYLAAVAGVYLGFANPHALHPGIALVFSAYLGVSIFFAEQAGFYYLPTSILIQGYAGFGLAIVGTANAKGVRRGISRTTLMCGVGMILFLMIMFGFYVAQDIALPFKRPMLPAIAGVLLGLLILQASVIVRSRPATTARYAAAPLAALALMLFPLGHWISSPHQTGSLIAGENVRVMTYNIHSGFDATGQLDLEEIAGVIEESGADIVGLQEVSRFRFMDASTDIPSWLSHRLGMAYVFRGTEEPVWGNALLSRFPIVDWGWEELPRAGKLIGRGYLWARIDVGGPEPMLVIVTHLHHLGPDSQARQEQVPALLEFWNRQKYTILLGDMNAEPESAEMEMISDAGLNDAWSSVGEGRGYTFSSLDPVKRIDWLWYSDELIPLEIEVIQTKASDHLPVQALFQVR